MVPSIIRPWQGRPSCQDFMRGMRKSLCSYLILCEDAFETVGRKDNANMGRTCRIGTLNTLASQRITRHDPGRTCPSLLVSKQSPNNNKQPCNHRETERDGEYLENRLYAPDLPEPSAEKTCPSFVSVADCAFQRSASPRRGVKVCYAK